MAARFAVAAAGGGAVGCGATLLYLQRKKQLGAEAPGAEFGELASHPALKYGMPVSDRLRTYPHFVAYFDTRLRNPKWTLEHISDATLRGGTGRRQNSAFYADPGIEPRFRSKLEDYRASGFDRGHLAPAANHKASQEAMDATFCLSNVCPQTGAGFNRDYWARFERFVQTLTQECSDVWIVSGPLYLPTWGGGGWRMHHSMLGTPPQLMAVPTHFFKIVLGELKASADLRSSADTAIGAWVMPNSQIDPVTPLSAFVVPLSALEEVSGLKFFPGYISNDRREFLDNVSLEWQRIGHQEQKKLAPPPTQPLLLLEAPSSSSSASPNGASQPGISNSRGPAASTTGADNKAISVRKHGVVHVCDQLGCELPTQKWWETQGRGAAPAPGSKGRG